VFRQPIIHVKRLLFVQQVASSGIGKSVGHQAD
jgi:hypothetical protein